MQRYIISFPISDKVNDNQKFTLWYLLILVIAIAIGYLFGYVTGLSSHPQIEIINNTIIAGNNSIPVNILKN